MDLMEVKILNTAIERCLNRELAVFNLTYTQAAIIGFLAQHQDQKVFQRDIEQALGLTHPTVSSIVSRLEEKNLIAFVYLKEDRRFKQLSMTPNSVILHRELQNKIDQITGIVFGGISENQQEALSSMFTKMIQNLSP
ncbi:MAG: hypothetical protein H6Q60_658 [Oscillospiraceae bacterium]|nr:hypothetical protein [Oscillospiraceae bacterium]